VKIKLDENLPADFLVSYEAPHDIDTVGQENLAGHRDAAVWEPAQGDERLFCTQDLDVSDLRSFMPGSHHGIVLVRLKNPSRRALQRRLKEVLSLAELETWARCFVVVTDSKIRVRRPA
jgi:predicted nuclease of predicted toxin-antitoxin system